MCNCRYFEILSLLSPIYTPYVSSLWTLIKLCLINPIFEFWMWIANYWNWIEWNEIRTIFFGCLCTDGEPTTMKLPESFGFRGERKLVGDPVYSRFTDYLFCGQQPEKELMCNLYTYTNTKEANRDHIYDMQEWLLLCAGLFLICKMLVAHFVDFFELLDRNFTVVAVFSLFIALSLCLFMWLFIAKRKKKRGKQKC